MPKIPIILGPTSTGKTQLALQLAKKFGAEIISADSRQVVQFMDVGTGKLPIGSHQITEKHSKCWTVNQITIWGYDLFTPDQYFSAYDWAQFAIAKTNELLVAKKPVFVVGGTGFYIDILTGKVTVASAKPNFALRRELESLNVPQLYDRLQAKNSVVDKNNKVRLIRAIENECSLVAHKSLQSLIATDFQFIGLTAPRATLYKNADLWVDTIWQAGLVEEIQLLFAKGYKDSLKLAGLVYKQALDFLTNKLSRKDAIQQTKFSIHAYIRRQQTYFKRNPQIQWFDITNPASFLRIEELLS